MQLLHQTKGRGANSNDNRLAEELYRASTSIQSHLIEKIWKKK